MRNLLSLAAIFLGALLFVGVSSGASAANADSGRSAYANSCASCHGNPQSYQGVSALSIQNAIQSNRGGMGRLSNLSAAELQDISTYLANPTGGTPSTTIPNPAAADSDRIFDWAESAYPQMFGTHSASRNVGGYYLRHYPGTDVYLATGNGQLCFYDAGHPEEGVRELGSLSDWLNRLAPATTSQEGTNDDDHGHDDDGSDHGSHEGDDD